MLSIFRRTTNIPRTDFPTFYRYRAFESTNIAAARREEFGNLSATCSLHLVVAQELTEDTRATDRPPKIKNEATPQI